MEPVYPGRLCMLTLDFLDCLESCVAQVTPPCKSAHAARHCLSHLVASYCILLHLVAFALTKVCKCLHLRKRWFHTFPQNCSHLLTHHSKSFHASWLTLRVGGAAARCLARESLEIRSKAGTATWTILDVPRKNRQSTIIDQPIYNKFTDTKGSKRFKMVQIQIIELSKPSIKQFPNHKTPEFLNPRDVSRDVESVWICMSLFFGLAYSIPLCVSCEAGVSTKALLDSTCDVTDVMVCGKQETW